MDKLHSKLKKLQIYFQELGSVVIAFSGGVDSTFMLSVAASTLARENVLAVTVVSDFFTEKEKIETERFCLDLGIRYIFLPIDILSVAGVAQNPKNRCYLCKYNLFTKIKEVAIANGIFYVCEGSNKDDLSDYRPGMQAIAELDIKSPLLVAELTKQDIRDLSKEMNLSTWNKPSFACLASRFAYGEEITTEKLKMVKQAEKLLATMGFCQYRVRIHGTMARIEIMPKDFVKIIAPEICLEIYHRFIDYGFSYVTLDLKGYRTGSMNEVI